METCEELRERFGVDMLNNYIFKKYFMVGSDLYMFGRENQICLFPNWKGKWMMNTNSFKTGGYHKMFSWSSVEMLSAWYARKEDLVQQYLTICKHSDRSGDIYEQLETKPHILCSLWRLMKAQTGPTVHSKSYSSELQSLCPAHDRTTAKDLLEQLGVAIMQVGLP